jgi:Fe-S cluster assembly iron-binding protein IscA
LSLYIKQGSGVTAFLDICDGSTTADITPTSQWVRYTKTGVWNTSLNFIDLEFRGTAGAYCYIWGAQLEAGAYATSYIPTLGTSVTRVADAALTGSVPSLIGQTSGTIFWQGSVDYRQSGDGHALALSGSASSFGDAILLYRQSSNGHLAIYIQIGGANQFATPLTYNDTSSISENDKYAIAYANNDLVVYKNGVQIISASSGSIPACNYFLLNEWNNTYVNTNITKQAILFPTRLSNSDLAALTA